MLSTNWSLKSNSFLFCYRGSLERPRRVFVSFVASVQNMPMVTTPYSCAVFPSALTDGHRATIQLPGNMKAAFWSSSAACQVKPHKSRVTTHVAVQPTADSHAYAEPPFVQWSSRPLSWLQVKAFIIWSYPSKRLCVYTALCTRGSLACRDAPDECKTPFCLAKDMPCYCIWFRRSQMFTTSISCNDKCFHNSY